MPSALDQLFALRPDLRNARREERVAFLAQELDRVTRDAIQLID